MNRKNQQSIYHVNVNVNLMGKNVIRINGGIMINRKQLASIIDNSVIMCDEIIDTEK